MNPLDSETGIKLMRGNLLQSLPPTTRSVEAFENLVQRPGARIERIVSRGHTTPLGKWYDQEQDEWVAIIEGEGEIEFLDPPEKHQLVQGDWLFIPAHRRHRVTHTSNPTVWLAIWL